MIADVLKTRVSFQVLVSNALYTYISGFKQLFAFNNIHFFCSLIWFLVSNNNYSPL